MIPQEEASGKKGFAVKQLIPVHMGLVVTVAPGPAGGVEGIVRLIKKSEDEELQYRRETLTAV
jgi:hypothetical protein